MEIDANLETWALRQKTLQPTNPLWKMRLCKVVLITTVDIVVGIQIKNHGDFREAVITGCVAVAFREISSDHFGSKAVGHG